MGPGNAAPTAEALLDDLLASDPSELDAEATGRLRRVGGSRADRLVLIGAGNLGSSLLEVLRSAGCEPVCFADNDPRRWGTLHGGLPVLSAEEAVSAHAGDSVFVVAVFNGSEVHRQFAGLGATVVPWPFVVLGHTGAAGRVFGGVSITLPSRVLACTDRIRAALELWDDDRSRAEFVGQVAWRLTFDGALLGPPDPGKDIYFAPDLVSLSDREVLVDCGAYDGDTIADFLSRTGGEFERIVAIEPDPGNCRSLRDRVASLPGGGGERVDVHQIAVGDAEGELLFDFQGNESSRQDSPDARTPVRCRRLDDVLDRISPTFVKADIEGGERHMIPGAAGLMAVSGEGTRWAICTYHAFDHVWELPLLAAGLGGHAGTRFALRRYAEDFWESVFYIVPA